ncbi:hypothetical protein KEM54_006482 [Ascosphaera aggregata]|nr:hypothetical protein KEM54_006482 [Ascosphaera aggregata]
MDGKLYFPDRRAKAVFFENTTLKIVCYANEKKHYSFDFVDINITNVRGNQLVGRTVSLHMAETVSVLCQGDILDVNAAQLTFVDPAAAVLANNRFEQSKNHTDDHQRHQSRALDAQLVRRHKSIAIIDLPPADRLDQDVFSITGCLLPSPCSENRDGKATGQHLHRRPEQRSYACIDLPTGDEVFGLSETFLDTPPSTNCPLNSAEAIGMRSFNEGSDCLIGDDSKVFPKTADADKLHAQGLELSGEPVITPSFGDSTVVPSQSSVENKNSVHQTPLPPKPASDVNESPEVATEQEEEDDGIIGTAAASLLAREGAKKRFCAAGKVSDSRCGEERADAMTRASPKTVSENVQRHDNVDVTSSTLEKQVPTVKETTGEELSLGNVTTSHSILRGNLCEDSQNLVIPDLDIQEQGSGVDKRQGCTSITQLSKKDIRINSKIVILKVNAKKLAEVAEPRRSFESAASNMLPATATLKRPSASKINRSSQKRREPTQWDLDYDDLAENKVKAIRAQCISAEQPSKISCLGTQGLQLAAGKPAKGTPDRVQVLSNKLEINLDQPGLPTPICNKPPSLTKTAAKSSATASLVKKGKQVATTDHGCQGVKGTQATEAIARKRPRRGAARRAEDKIAQTKAYEDAAWDISDPIESSYPGETNSNTVSVQRALQASDFKSSGGSKAIALVKTNHSAGQLELEPRKENKYIPIAQNSKNSCPEQASNQLSSQPKLNAPKSPIGHAADQIPVAEAISDGESLSITLPPQNINSTAACLQSGAKVSVKSICSELRKRQQHAHDVSSSSGVVETSEPDKQTGGESKVQTCKPLPKPKTDFGQTLAAKLATAGLPSKASPAAAIQQSKSKPQHALTAITENVSRFMSRHVDTGHKNPGPSSTAHIAVSKPVEVLSGASSDRDFDESELSNLDPFSEPLNAGDQKTAPCQKVGAAVTEYIDSEKNQKKVQVVSFGTSSPKHQNTGSAKKPQREETVSQKPTSKRPLPSCRSMPSNISKDNKSILKQAAEPRASQPKQFPLSQVNENGSPMPIRPANRHAIGLSLHWDLSSTDDTSGSDSGASTYVPPSQFQEAKRAHGDTPMPKRIRLIDSNETNMTASEFGSLYEPIGNNNMKRSNNTSWLQRHPTMIKRAAASGEHAADYVAKRPSNPAPKYAKPSNERHRDHIERPVTVNQGRDSLCQRRRFAGVVAPALQSKPGADSLPTNDKALMTSPELESCAEASAEEESDNSQEDQSITLVEPDSYLNTPEAQQKWQRALHATHQTTLDILLDISQRLVRHMISEEEAITKILITYSAGCTRMIEQFVQTHQTYLKEYSAKAEPAIAKLIARCEEMRHRIERDRRAVLSGQPSFELLGNALGKRKRLHRRISDTIAKYGIAV